MKAKTQFKRTCISPNLDLFERANQKEAFWVDVGDEVGVFGAGGLSGVLVGVLDNEDLLGTGLPRGSGSLCACYDVVIVFVCLPDPCAQCLSVTTR